MSTLYEKIIAVVMGVHNRSLTYRDRREKLARTRKEIQSDRLYPWDVGTGSVFRNVENLSMYLCYSLSNRYQFQITLIDHLRTGLACQNLV